MAQTAATIWRNYETDGVPSSGIRKPDKTEIVNWGTYLEAVINAGVLTSGVWHATRPELEADLAPNDKSIAVVYEDATDSNNGVYRKTGSAGVGSWTQITTFLPGYQFVSATDDGNSTANAYAMNTMPRLPAGDGVALISFVVPETSTSSVVTVSFDGGDLLPILTAAGNEPAIGGLVAGMPVFGIVLGGKFLMRSDQSSAAIQAACEAARDAAEAAAGFGNVYADRPTAQAATVPALVQRISLIGPNGELLDYGSHASGISLVTADGRKWSPVGVRYASHYGIQTHATEGAALAASSQATLLEAALAEGDLISHGFIHIGADVDAQDKGHLRFLSGDLAISGGASFIGVTFTAGQHDQPHTGGLGASDRNGKAGFIHREKRVTSDEANEQDSAYYIEIEQLAPFPNSGNVTEYAALRLNGKTKSDDPSGGGIRVLHVTATGDGGSGKVRAQRSVAIGYNGHDGLITGGLTSAVRTGLIPASAGGNGVDEYASGDAGPYPNEDSVHTFAVGPGIRRVVVMEGQAGKERPQVGFLQKFGNQALLPELAVCYWHGGGNGDIIRIARDETDASDLIAVWNKDGRVAAQGIRSNVDLITIPNNTAVTFPLQQNGGFLSFHSPGSSARWGVFFFRAIAGAEVCTALHAGGSVDAAIGPHTGLTGATNKVTVAIDGQNVSFENQTGNPISLNYSVTA